MRNFVTKLFLFGIICGVLFLAFHLCLMHTRYKLLKFPKNITTLFVGNSTMECAVNDQLLSNSYNFARSAEPLNYLYAKIKLLKEINPQIDTIIMSFDDIILFKTDLNYPTRPSLYFVDQFDGDDWYSNISNVSFEQISNMFTHLYDFILIRPMIKSYFGQLDIRQLDLGGYSRIDRNKLQKDLELRKRKNQITKNIDEIPPHNLHYLDKIINYCSSNRIELIFLSTPKYKEVWKDTVYREVHKKYYPMITLLDYMQVSIPDSCFGDTEHLNKYGSDYFTSSILLN